jgi:hypothetical protein
MELREHALQPRLSDSAVLFERSLSARLVALSRLGSALPFALGRL